VRLVQVARPARSGTSLNCGRLLPHTCLRKREELPDFSLNALLQTAGQFQEIKMPGEVR
jgi:hypothetical protein